ncbi:serine hydrolase [Geobacter sp.]|uniref:serine hydrolase domain-containing protein n=1 Tax=Geobacter sp. TaxID=46610 RepID=UPI001AD5A54C|nr:serine hydrolase domain-containing protein [Geobacter sp.]CAG0933430.1 serine-type D-Ala-D-Ala carboxypeptidase [Rhodocyclaceae bacterium]
MVAPMLSRKVLTLVILFFTSLPAFAGDTPIAPSPWQSAVSHLMDKAMADGLIAGGVVLVGNRHGVVYESAFGRVSGVPGAVPVTTDTIFDAASLTKVVATAPAVMKLVEQGRLSLVDPLIRWFPEFAGRGKDELRVVHLLTHTSGLDDLPIAPGNPLLSAVEGVALQKLKGEPGNRFRYADINFILLGELVRRVTGAPLDLTVAEGVYGPLSMGTTCFNPGPAVAGRCAATLDAGGNPLFGRVQDHSAHLLDGVAGHAGIFTTAGDLARFCRMILGEGELDGRRVLEARTVRQMTAPYFSRGGTVRRGLGWDIASPFSSPKGSGFSEASFGHTGYSGSSIWIDPENDSFVIFLSARLDYRNTRAFSKLRNDLSSVAFAMLYPGLRELAEIAMSDLPPVR